VNLEQLDLTRSLDMYIFLPMHEEFTSNSYTCLVNSVLLVVCDIPIVSDAPVVTSSISMMPAQSSKILIGVGVA